MDEGKFREIIGWIQVIFGVLLVITMIVSLMIIPGYVRDFNFDVHEKYVEALEENNFSIAINETSGQILQQSTITRGLMDIENMILFGMLELLLFVLAVILVLQGLLNIKQNY